MFDPFANVENGGRELAGLLRRNPGHLGVEPGEYRADDAERCRGKIQRSEEHTSELQSRQYLVCRLLLEKKKNTNPHSQKLSNTTTRVTFRVSTTLTSVRRAIIRRR